ncbi:hypothetical protein H920_05266 [Fukomys damarensis]|uniref:Uncharacterized protein n=1 Tax=Fukomys damarensis TaxID=885580 RepID=A0A091DSB9_FUKDA|nr:hypothetical protein H920_05266 [Fukomys damarensis]
MAVRGDRKAEEPENSSVGVKFREILAVQTEPDFRSDHEGTTCLLLGASRLEMTLDQI